MNKFSAYEELDQAIDRMLAADAGPAEADAEVAELAQIAGELRDLPRANFQARLKLELEWAAAGRTVTVGRAAGEIMPSLLGGNWAGYPVRRSNFALSVALHAVMMLAVGAGLVAVKNSLPQVDRPSGVSVRLEPYRPPIGLHPNSGGGSGGAAEKILASRGVAPPASREQLTPPMIQQNRLPHLAADATVIAPPDLVPPRTKQIGDPLSELARPSNGPGVGGGMGGNFGGGVGDVGNGPGRGNGSGGGCCEGVYTIGDGVSMPRAIYSPEPEFSEEARRVKQQGEVTLLATIGADGLPRNLTVVRSLGMGLDEKALEAVHTWRFEPARKGGHPVAVKMNIIVNFHLY